MHQKAFKSYEKPYFVDECSETSFLKFSMHNYVVETCVEKRKINLKYIMDKVGLRSDIFLALISPVGKYSYLTLFQWSLIFYFSIITCEGHFPNPRKFNGTSA